MTPEGVREWFNKHVTYEGEAYTVDLEQAAAIADESKNTIVVARAGSGKTRTIVAKIVYLVAIKNLKPEEIMVFVFNANAAKEINERLLKMLVDGRSLMELAPSAKPIRIASTFHAFSRKIVYDIYGGRDKCGKILAGDKEKFLLYIIYGMLRSKKWREKIRRFVGSETEEELRSLSKMMTIFVNRAQQKFLASEGVDGAQTLTQSVNKILEMKDVTDRERDFVELGAECYRRYHWYLLKPSARARLKGNGFDFTEYGTDFNLIVAWAGRIIASGHQKTDTLLKGKKYILIDEYQDFSQLFLSVVMAIRTVAKNARLFVVGDDWQAINRFAGSEVEYFKEFKKYFKEDTRRLVISTNYRCNYEIVRAARIFMKKAMREKGDFRAFSKKAGKVMLVDPDLVEVKPLLVSYDKRVGASDRLFIEVARKMVKKVPKLSTIKYIKTLTRIIAREKAAGEILILHRNNETNLEGVSLERLKNGLKNGIVRLGEMSEQEFDEKIRIMTMHKSKGLEAEVVIILEADVGVIPKTHPDTKLYRVFGETEEIALDDQKRLFYVAMTRAKKRLYIIHKGSRKEGFIKYLGRTVEVIEVEE